MAAASTADLGTAAVSAEATKGAGTAAMAADRQAAEVAVCKAWATKEGLALAAARPMGCRPGQWPCSAGGASARCVHGGGAVSKLLCCHEVSSAGQ
eukprot:1148597-Pelagomonas_calceolata.AAC.9